MTPTRIGTPLFQQIIFLLALVIIVLTPLPCHGNVPPRFENDARDALTARDAFYERVQLPPAFSVGSHLASVQREQLEEIISVYPDDGSPWHSLLHALTAETRQDTATSDHFFAQAIDRSSPSAGWGWVLFAELERQGIERWMEPAIESVHRELIAGATDRQHLVSQHLLSLGSERTPAEAAWFFRWAARFDPHSPWPPIRLLLTSFYRQGRDGLRSLASLARILQTSWWAQLAALDYLLALFTTFSLFLALSVGLSAAAKYGSRTLHPLNEAFPAGVPVLVRQILTGAVMAAITLAGALFVLWALFLSLRPHLKKKERIFFALTMLVITLHPTIGYIHASVREIRRPGSPAETFFRVRNEAPDFELFNSVRQALQRTPNNPLVHNSAALLSLKTGHYERALNQARRAHTLKPGDPVSLQIEGIAAAALQRYDQASASLHQAVAGHPHNTAALFNLSSFLMTQLRTTEGDVLLNQARTRDSHLVDGYVRDNDRYFDQSVPLLRHFMLPNYPGTFFWREFLLAERLSREGASPFWGKRFLGFSAAQSQFLFAVLFIFGLTFFPAGEHSPFRLRSRLFWKPAKREFSPTTVCDTCGAAMCSRCSRGGVCATCSRLLRVSVTEEQAAALRQRRSRFFVRKRVILATVFNTLYPGSGFFYEGRLAVTPTAGLLVLSSLLASLLVALHVWTFEYPSWVAFGIHRMIVLCSGAYLATFLAIGFTTCSRLGLLGKK